MDILNFIKEYWVQIIFLFGVLVAMYRFSKAMIEAAKCSLRNDILEVYDRCKARKKITKWQLESIMRSYKLYKTLKGNSFVDALVKKVQAFEVKD